MFFNFKKNRHIDPWKAFSSVLEFNKDKPNYSISFQNEIGIICWDENNELDSFSVTKLPKIISDGDSGTKTKFEFVEEKGEMSWVILSDENYDDLVSTAYTLQNAFNDLISIDFVVAIILKIDISDNSYIKLDDLSAYSIYLVFNNNPMGFYPLVYSDEKKRQPFIEIQIFDILKKSSLFLNKNQNNWYSVENIPF
jgi:hypothetical protein